MRIRNYLTLSISIKWLLIVSFCFFFSLLKGQISNEFYGRCAEDSLFNTALKQHHIFGERLYKPDLLFSFYSNNGYSKIWNSYTESQLKFNQLLHLLESCEEDGLQSRDYHVEVLKRMAPNISMLTCRDAFKLDVLLSDAFLYLFNHIYSGITKSEPNPEWECWNNNCNLEQKLYQSIQNNTLLETYQQLLPVFPQYSLLKKSLRKLNDSLYLDTSNQKIKYQIETITLNLERWRWLPKQKDSVYIIVNIPAYKLSLYMNDSLLLRMKIIVGKPNNETPSFNSEITHVILHPQWNIPPSIVNKEILPAFKKDRNYLENNNIEIRKSWSIDDTTVFSANSLFRNSLSLNHLSYKLVQKPGPENPLGNIKFMFSNQFNVYLHDTPDSSLFREKVRTFSHGCIRLESPTKLAALLLKNDSILQLTSKDTLFAKNEKRILPEPVSIYINYWTAWVSENGVVEFYDDPYGSDAKLKKMIKEKK